MKKILGIAMAVMLVAMAGCSLQEEEQTSTTETTVETTQQVTKALQQTNGGEEALYKHYLQDKLVPQYGVMIGNQEVKTTTPEREWLEPKGIASVYIDDLDGDNLKEMVVFHFNNEDNTTGHSDMEGDHLLYAEVYSITDGSNVTLMDKQVVYGYHEALNTPVTLYKNQHLHDHFFATAVTANNNNKYIVCEYSTKSTVFSDGGYEGYWALEYKNNKLNIAFSLTQTGPGSAELYYNGFNFNNGETEKKELLYSQTGYGKYKSLSEAVNTFFNENGIKVNYTDGEKSIITDENTKTEIFSYSVEPSNQMSDSTVSVDMKFVLNDNTKIVR